MSTKKETFGDISQGLSILVDEISQGNRKKFAMGAGIVPATLHNYLNGRVPKADALVNICKSYNINLNWLLTGKGPKYITNQGDTQILDPDPEIAELMEGARRVLTSGNPVAFDALERNIRYFDHAIAAEKRADASERKIKEMEEDMAAIKNEIINMKKQKCEDEKRCQEDQLPEEKVA